MKKIGDVIGIDTRSESVKNRKKRNGKIVQSRKSDKNPTRKRVEGTKLRFLRNDVWEEKDYLKMSSGNAIQQIIRIRLNMSSPRMNYEAKYNNYFMCPLCKKERDRTEHVLTCEEMPECKFMENDLYNTRDVLWVRGPRETKEQRRYGFLCLGPLIQGTGYAAKWTKTIQLFQTNEKLWWDQ